MMDIFVDIQILGFSKIYTKIINDRFRWDLKFIDCPSL